MIRHSPALAKTKEFAQRQAVRATPFQPTLAVDAFKVADQQHTEVASRRQRWTAEARRIVQGTLRLDEPIETCRDQNRLQLVVEGVAWRAWHLSPRHQHVRLAFPLPSKSHPPPAVLVRQPTNQIRTDFVNGLLGAFRPATCARILLATCCASCLATGATPGSGFPALPFAEAVSPMTKISGYL